MLAFAFLFFLFLLLFLPFLRTGYLSSLFHTSVLCPFWAGSTIKHLINTIKASDLARRTSLKEMPKRASKDKDDNNNDNDNEDDIKINIKQKGSDKRKPAKAVGDETCLQLPERYKSGIKTFFYEPKFKPAHKNTLPLVRGEVVEREGERRDIEKERHVRGGQAEERARVSHLWQENPPKCATPGRGMGVQSGGVAMFWDGHMASFYANKRTFLRNFAPLSFSFAFFLLAISFCPFLYATLLSLLCGSLRMCGCVCLLFCHCDCFCCCCQIRN